MATDQRMIDDYDFYPFIDIKADSDFEIDNIVADLGLNRTQQCVLTDRLFNEIKMSVWPDDGKETDSKKEIKPPYCELRVFYQDMFVAGVDLAMLIEIGFRKGNICEDEEEIAALRTIQVVVETEIQKRLRQRAP